MFLRYISGFILGSLLGGLIGYLAKCASGTCPITSNPYISTTYGMIMGLLLSIDNKKDKRKEDA